MNRNLSLFGKATALILGLISTTPSFASQMDIEETYSDEKPKSKLVFSIDPKKDKGWNYKKDREILMNGQTIELLTDAGLSSIPGGFGLSQNSTDFLFVDQSEILLIKSQYKENSLDLSLDTIAQNSKIYSMSWSYIKKALQQRSKRCHVPKYNEEQLLFQRIEEEKTTDFINRIAVIANAQHRYAFYAIYDNDNQLEKTENILKTIYEKLSNKNKK